ncbi:hypothetical protein BGZ80_000302 [Entomortierella chlamydospora]|uniref:Uncharacterized protein n=1 Tax=Entomortierella chlamydospora TaxID=101097 RepID=A0A9P6T3Q7_9FUNG|nr:hypothetical protein BGZ80_000302 [Entomortierella chlamydospora]
MQPALYSNVRNNLSNLPRSISPHLGSPVSSSSASPIRSLSPSHHNTQLRSRSSSPTPRRFASVLAFHATPPPESYGKRRAASGDQLSQQQQQQQQRSEYEEREVSNSRDRGNTDKDGSPGRAAFKNLEDNWKKFELDSAVTSPPPVTSNSTLGSSLSRPASPLSRSASPMPPSKLPYRELIECDSLNQARSGEAKEAAASSSLSSDDPNGLSAPLGETKNRDHTSQLGHTKSMTESQSKPSDPEVSASSNSLSPKPKEEAAATTMAVTAAAAANYHSQHTQGFGNTFLASNEARHILDLPSLLGRDPNMIPEVLAMPVPLQAKHTSREVPSSGSDNGAGANMLSKLNAKAEATAQAMTKRHATKKLNITETEAHRMVRMMAEEIVALHREREVMAQKLELAKHEMLEAAKLLRAKAVMTEAAENAGKEMQDMSSSSSSSTESRPLKQEGQEREEEEERQRQNASLYDKDEWKV